MTTGLGNYIRILKPGIYLHWCPACHKAHQFNISTTDHPQGKRWGWDGDLAKPSVDPELEHREEDGTLCRYILRGGILLFFDDCTHPMAGRVAPLPAFPLPDRLSVPRNIP